MRNLAGRLHKLERRETGGGFRPAILLTPGDDEAAKEAKLAEWQERYGPCDAEPLFIQLVAVAP